MTYKEETTILGTISAKTATGVEGWGSTSFEAYYLTITIDYTLALPDSKWGFVLYDEMERDNNETVVTNLEVTDG